MKLEISKTSSIDGALILQFKKNGELLSNKNPVTPSEIREFVDMIEPLRYRQFVIIVGMPMVLVTAIVAKLVDNDNSNAIGVYMHKERIAMIVWSSITSYIVGHTYDFRL